MGITSPLLLHFDGIGPISIMHSRRAKRLRITVHPSGVRVSVPRGLTLAQGREFARYHRDWICRHVMRMEKRLRDQSDAARNLPSLSDQEAREKLGQRLTELAERHGLTFTRVSIRRQKTRWGSCSQGGAINLNIALAKLPQDLMDYVILHELLHTRIKSHGRIFWKELECLHSQAVEHHRQLRSYSPEMMDAIMQVQSERR